MRLQSWFVICALSLVSINQSIADGGDVPIDGARGSYEGAENIHWYMQDSLNSNSFEQDAPYLAEPYQCNSPDETYTCDGDLLSKPYAIYKQNSRAWIKVAILVDSRIDSSYRFALKQIRDTNRIFDRSGIRARLFVSDIRGISMVEEFNDDPQFAVDEIYRLRNELTEFNGADIIIAMFDPSVDRPQNSEYCGLGTLGPFDIQVAVINCRYDENVVAHEIGHNLGLLHDPSAPSNNEPAVTSGVGYIEPISGVGSVMSYATGNKAFPLFSSPYAYFTNTTGQVVVLGSQDANAASAANAAVVWLANQNEAVHSLYSESYYQYVVTEDGRLVQTNELATDIQDEMRNAWSSLVPPEPIFIED